MISLKIDENGIISSIEGAEIHSVYQMHSEQLLGLPYKLVDPEPLNEGVQTRFVGQRNGDAAPVQIAIMREGSEWTVWVEPLLGDQRDRLCLSYLQTMFQGIAYVAEYGDPELLDHLKRVARYTRFVAEKVLGWDPSEVQRLEIAALIHDVGKTAIPRDLLLKPGTFHQKERLYMQQHTERGYQVIIDLEQSFPAENAWMIDKRLFQFARDVTLYHHENWDGSGYPTNRAEETIPLVARIVKVVDAIDALLSYRVYKTAWPWEKVKEELVNQSGIEFDATLVKGLLEHEKEFLDIVQELNVSVPSFAL